MGIRIHNILGKFEDYSICELGHGTDTMVAKVWDGDGSLKENNQIDVLVELSYDQLKAVKSIDDFNDYDSLIAAKDEDYLLWGRVSSIHEFENDAIIDIYLQTGPEFIAILKSETGELSLNVGQGVEFEVSDLRFYPTNI